MSWWQSRLNKKKQHRQIKTTGQMNASYIAQQAQLPVVVSPVTGKLSMTSHEKAGYRGFKVSAKGRDIVSPVSGIVDSSDDERLKIQSAKYGIVDVILQSDTSVAHLAILHGGQQLHAGDAIGAVCGLSDEVVVSVLLDENVNISVNEGIVYAGQNVWKRQETLDESK